MGLVRGGTGFDRYFVFPQLLRVSCSILVQFFVVIQVRIVIQPNHINMRDSSNDSSWSSSCNGSKEGLEDEMLLEKPLHRLTTHAKDDTSHWVRKGKKMLIPLNCAFLVINALVWLFVLGKQPISSWGAFGGIRTHLVAPQVFSPCKLISCETSKIHKLIM